MALLANENASLNPMSFSDQHGSIVFERLRYQRDTGRFCDVALFVKERQFAAHRNILASCSPYFDSIFKYSKITKEQVTVNSEHPVIFESLLNYMYSGSIIIDKSNVAELLRLSNNFLIFKLKLYCTEYLDRYLDAGNCLAIINLATRYNVPSLLKTASDYFDVNVNRCLLEALDIGTYNYPQLIKLIQDPKYVDVITADTYLKLIVRWVGEEQSTRELSFRHLVERVNFRELSQETLDFLLDYSPLLAKSPPSRYLILHLMNENDMLGEKYAAQFSTLRQSVELPILYDPMIFLTEEGSSDEMEDEEMECPVEGQPTTAQIIEQDSDGNPILKLKIHQPALVKRFKKPRFLLKRNGRPRDVIQENEMIPMVDDDEIDGVYATSALEGAHTYGPVDLLDPDDLLEKHRARAHNRNTFYLCHLCEFETNWSKEFYQHCQEHWTELPYQCESCSYSSPSSIQDYLVHRLTHTKNRYFKCGECAWKGRTRSQLFAHERMHSVLDNRPLHCEECGRGFHVHTALDQHIATHNDHRSLICEDCGFATKTANSLAMHRRQHTGDVFFCHITGCEYSTNKKTQLAAHLRTHMAVRAHMCKICGRGFIEKSHLVRHERIHLEDKPFKCDTCEYASSRRDKLKEHILKHHNGQTTSKAQRRRYKRQRMLAQATSIVESNASRILPNDSQFRPIPIDESVSRWTQSNDFGAYSPSGPNEFEDTNATRFSPPTRSFSVTNPPIQHAPLSPGCMSMMNVPLREAEPSMSGALITPTPRSPHNHSADYFVSANNGPDSQQRPLSLPNYGQLDAQQQQQQQSIPPPNDQWW
ncbi:unnamed protein product [Caenorhabditis bovis]|uniref:BTB domain-containing protein n=1 Tax=Caenorhabditis bovis TaxID=2654633 RepID=A0A8S1FCE2_9PELO|nr:unnamed protein product [Caenorhabditis bovis]